MWFKNYNPNPGIHKKALIIPTCHYHEPTRLPESF